MRFLPGNTDIKRLKHSMLFGIKTLMPSLVGFIFSWLIIRYYSKDLWGSVVSYSLWVYVLGTATVWGSKDYLLRSISQQPAALQQLFSSSLITRSLLLPAAALVLWLHTANQVWMLSLCCLWLFVRFIYQSFDTLVFFEKKFGLLILVEVLGGLASIVGLLCFPAIANSLGIVFLLMISDAIKAAVTSGYFYKSWNRLSYWKFDRKHLLNAWIFVAMGFTGLIVSKADQFIVNYYLSNHDKAFYQIYLNLLLLVTLTPGLVIVPALKNLYRSPEIIFKKVQLLLLKIGIFITPISISIIYLIIRYFYGFSINPLLLMLGSLLIFPGFIYSLFIYFAFKNNHQIYILIINLLGLSISFFLGNILAPIYGTIGALTGAVAGQWLIMILVVAGYYRGLFKAKKLSPSSNMEEAVQ